MAAIDIELPQAEPAESAGRSFHPWTVVLGSALALAFGAVPILQYTSGLFMAPLQKEFGWNRVELSLGISSVQLISMVSVFFVGWAMDRWGIKRVIAPLIALFATNVALMATMNSLAMYVTLYALFGVTSTGLNPVGFMKSISAYVHERRGLAMGVALSGTALGAAIVPRFAEYMIAAHGWRHAYLALALLPALVALPSVLIFLREPEGSRSRVRDGRRAKREPLDELPGLTMGEALVTRSFWLLALAIFLVSAVLNGTIAHAVPFLVDHGYSAAAAASVLSGVGLASVAGRICSGTLFDRFFAPHVAVAFFLLCIAGLFLLANLKSAEIAMICVGLTLGFELDMVGYLVPRYFGLRKFGQIYGLLFGALNAGGAVGPLAMGAAYTLWGSYEFAFVSFGLMLLVACAMVIGLPAYPYGILRRH
ncbi:MFS transporter [Flavisphingomonas formosensis]|uniref:MFS transporter n=1 Tax=Flavisphingomonas formosensis TaxID=861534 RepID=UPI0012F78F86|nr:MFS transporter [Sphingomonas formosensis]